MRVFVTGATGFVGSAVVEELIRAGHHVTGLSRSDGGDGRLRAAGAEPFRGDLKDVERLRSAAAASEGVVHTGFVHDFANFKECCEIDRRAILALGEGLAGSKRPLLVTSGTAMVHPGAIATEDERANLPPDWPRASEAAAETLVEKGVNASIVRLSPSVHGDGDKIGFVPLLIGLAREKGVSAYIDEGRNRWTAVHRLDAATLFRLALEKPTPGARYHGVAESEISFRSIAESIGKKLNLPTVGVREADATAHFGWFSKFAAFDIPASSAWTRETLGWKPTRTELIADIENGKYI